MSRVHCPSCGHRFSHPTTDEEFRFWEDAAWEVAVTRLKKKRKKPIYPPFLPPPPLPRYFTPPIIPPTKPDPYRPRG